MQYINPSGNSNHQSSKRALVRLRRQVISLALGLAIFTIGFSSVVNTLINSPSQNSFAQAPTTTTTPTLAPTTTAPTAGTTPTQTTTTPKPATPPAPPTPKTPTTPKQTLNIDKSPKIPDGLFAPQSDTKIKNCDFLSITNDPETKSGNPDAVNGVLTQCFKDILSIVVIIAIVISIGMIGYTAITIMNPLQDSNVTSKMLGEKIQALIVGGLLVGSFGTILFTINPASTRLDGIFSSDIICQVRTQINTTLQKTGGTPLKVKGCAESKTTGSETTGSGTSGDKTTEGKNILSTTSPASQEVIDAEAQEVSKLDFSNVDTAKFYAEQYAPCFDINVTQSTQDSGTCKVVEKIKDLNLNVYEAIIVKGKNLIGSIVVIASNGSSVKYERKFTNVEKYKFILTTTEDGKKYNGRILSSCSIEDTNITEGAIIKARESIIKSNKTCTILYKEIK